MRITRQRRRARRGGAVVEMALVTPVLLTIILGQIEMIRLGMVTQLLSNAARDGCREAVVDVPGVSDDTAHVRNHIKGLLSDAGIALPDANIEILGSGSYTWQNAPLGTPIQVRLKVRYADVSWLPELGIFGNPEIRVSATFASERNP